jgi:hypothetical protein
MKVRTQKIAVMNLDISSFHGSDAPVSLVPRRIEMPQMKYSRQGQAVFQLGLEPKTSAKQRNVETGQYPDAHTNRQATSRDRS